MKLKSKLTAGAVFLGGLVVAGVVAGAVVEPRQGYAPSQPIFFQHKKMAAKPDWLRPGMAGAAKITSLISSSIT